MARNNGIFAVRRIIAAQSHETLVGFVSEFADMVRGTAKDFTVDSLSATVISLSRFSKRQVRCGPTTESIYGAVESAADQLSARIGELAIYGSDKKSLLALRLHGDGLIKEEAEFRRIYKERYGYELRPDINSQGSYSPHLSIALVNSDHASYYKQAEVLYALNRSLCLRSILNAEIILNPPLPFPDYSMHA